MDAWINLEAKTQGFLLNPSESLPSLMRVDNTSQSYHYIKQLSLNSLCEL